jgi:ankyrin repeat protein
LAVVNELLSPNDILGKRKSRGANTEATDRHGSTPLHLASEGGHLPVVKALLSGGANILAANKQRMLPIYDESQKWPSVYPNSYMQQSVVPLYTNS